MRDRYASLREGLAGAWIPSVSGSGLLLPDLSGQGNNGTLTNMGPEDWVSGQYGRALDFDGSNDYVAIPHSPELSFGNGTTDLPFSVSFFVNSSGFSPGDFIGKNDATVTQREWRIILRGVADQFLFVLYDANFSNQISAEISTVTIDDGNWHHVTCVYSGNRSNTGLKIYFDAVEQSVVRASAGTYVAMEAYTNPIWIGRVISLYQTMKTDDIRIYNRALSESEIKLLASRPGIGLRPQRRTMYYAPPTGARRRRILTSMP